MKRFLLFPVIMVIFCQTYAQTDALSLTIKKLNQAIQKIPELDGKRQAEIKELKQELARISEADLHKLFQLYISLYDAYQLFQYDSAYSYARKLQAISLRLQNEPLINCAHIKLGFTLLSSGMYTETLASLSTVDLRAVNDSSKAVYYALFGRYYYDLGDYDNDQ